LIFVWSNVNEIKRILNSDQAPNTWEVSPTKPNQTKGFYKSRKPTSKPELKGSMYEIKTRLKLEETKPKIPFKNQRTKQNWYLLHMSHGSQVF
jgi:hypothetical protein